MAQDELEELIEHYEKLGHVEELSSLLEAGLGLELCAIQTLIASSVISTYKSNKYLYTLGMTAKPPGRIGDSPVIGAGTFASDGTCAVSGTGNGELFLAHSVAATISAFVSEFTLLPMSGARRALSLSYPCHE